MENADDTTSITEMLPADKGSRTYRAYLLRCWCEEAVPGSEPVWRFSLLEILPQKRRQGFGNLEALLDFLRQQLKTGR